MTLHLPHPAPTRMPSATPALFCYCREFVEQILPQFKADNAQVAIEAVVRRGKHPGLEAEYRERLLVALCCPLLGYS